MKATLFLTGIAAALCLAAYSFLLRNHDRIFLTMEMNLAGCQNQLGYKDWRGAGSTKNMRNVLPAFKGRHHVNKKAETGRAAPKNKP